MSSIRSAIDMVSEWDSDGEGTSDNEELTTVKPQVSPQKSKHNAFDNPVNVHNNDKLNALSNNNKPKQFNNKEFNKHADDIINKSNFGLLNGNNRQRNLNRNSDKIDETKNIPYIPPEPTNNEEEIFGQGIGYGINFSKYDEIEIKVSGENIPNRINTFEEMGFNEILQENIQKSSYQTPTPIQKQAFPLLNNGRDVMGCAQTGSGKTAAYLLPIIDTLLKQNDRTEYGKPRALILTPTRELTIQIFNEARKFAIGSCLKICHVYGGTSIKYQQAQYARGCHVLVATVGRLIDFMNSGIVEFDQLKFLVLDEADRMIDTGFLNSVEEIIRHPNVKKAQTLMFSATFPEKLQQLAGKFLKDYVFIAVGIVGGACSDVEQTIYLLERFEKRRKLLELLDKEEASGTIVFVETKRQADFLASFLSETSHPTTSIHGDRHQQQREKALADFKSSKMKVLIATSVAARGLDIKNARHVINYDLPTSIDEYVHRIGRTGRMGNRGKASSFYDNKNGIDEQLAPDLVKILRQAEQTIPDFLLLTRTDERSTGKFDNYKFGATDIRENRRKVNKDIINQEPNEKW